MPQLGEAAEPIDPLALALSSQLRENLRFRAGLVKHADLESLPDALPFRAVGR